MGKLSEDVIEELAKKKLEGESYSLIRSNLKDQGFNDEEIKSIVRQVDKRVLQAEIDQGSRNMTKSWYQIGLALAIVGLLLTIGFNAGWLLKGTSRWIVYSPFIVGILLMLYGRLLRQKKINPFEKGPDNIRKKRPYK